MKRADPTLDKLLLCAVEASTNAGNHALRNSSRRKEATAYFSHDVKLLLDQECQARAEKTIKSFFPDHFILGEETANDRKLTPGLNDYEWIIDPIDGTVNFTHGLPAWCCSIAVRRGSEVLAGVVYAPEMKELYTATAETQSVMNGKKISVSETKGLKKSLIMTGLDKNFDESMPPLEIFKTISLNVRKARVYGSAAWDLCAVARGISDGYFETGIYIWDIAAAGLIVKQAGGKTEIIQDFGGHRMSFLATNGHIHRNLKKTLMGVIRKSPTQIKFLVR